MMLKEPFTSEDDEIEPLKEPFSEHVSHSPFLKSRNRKTKRSTIEVSLHIIDERN